jgi:soluble lytic murein transglycosylase-like protein
MRRSVTFLLACSLLGAAAPAFAALTPLPESGKPAPAYARLSKAERLAYVEARAREVSQALTGPGGASVAITPDALRLIAFEVDEYARRLGSSSSNPWREDIRNVLDRGAASAPAIRRAFEAEGVPPVIGLYLAMVESEFHPCLESPSGARGMFQFLPKTGSLYGVEPEALCDLEKAAPAAARYLRDRRAEFGPDPLGAVLALLSYNQGQTKTREVFGGALNLAKPEDREREFWAVLARPEEKGLERDVERGRYVPRFFAAAIVGESPADFGIKAQPLSAR